MAKTSFGQTSENPALEREHRIQRVAEVLYPRLPDLFNSSYKPSRNVQRAFQAAEAFVEECEAREQRLAKPESGAA